ncbi:MAG: zinc-binding dehydrogenase [Aquabacterium sp.]|nr:zinc-binding dehydrogenase [Aquabacterium sp.]
MITRQQLVIERNGGPEVIRLIASPLPPAGPQEITVKVVAAGVNFADIMARQGLYPDAPPKPMVVGYEVAGDVIAVGAGVDAAWVGKRVVGLTRFGGYSSHLNVPVNQLFEIPASLSYHEAASIPVAYGTAYALVVALGGLKRHETILIQNAGGGVGLAILDLARHIGATTIGTASPGKHAFLKQRGLDHAVDYNQPDWADQVLKLTDQRGVALITDPLGGESWRKAGKLLRSTGRLGMFGISAAADSSFMGKLKLLKTAIQMPLLHPVGLMNRNHGAFGVNMGHLWHEPEMIRMWMEEILQGVADGWVRPHVDKVFPFEQAGQAHAHMEQRRNIGKVLLAP